MKEKVKNKTGGVKMKKLAVLGVVVLAVSLVGAISANAVSIGDTQDGAGLNMDVTSTNNDFAQGVDEFEGIMTGFVVGDKPLFDFSISPELQEKMAALREEIFQTPSTAALICRYRSSDEIIEKLNVLMGVSHEVLQGVELSEIPDSSSSVLNLLNQLEGQSPLISQFIKDVETGKAIISEPKISLKGDVLSIAIGLTPGGAWLLPSPAYDNGFFGIQIDKATGNAILAYRPVTPNNRNSSIIKDIRVKSLDERQIE